MEQKEKLCPKNSICENYLGFLWMNTSQYKRAVEQEHPT